MAKLSVLVASAAPQTQVMIIRANTKPQLPQMYLIQKCVVPKLVCKIVWESPTRKYNGRFKGKSACGIASVVAVYSLHKHIFQALTTCGVIPTPDDIFASQQ
jgi:hypothetical protein